MLLFCYNSEITEVLNFFMILHSWCQVSFITDLKSQTGVQKSSYWTSAINLRQTNLNFKIKRLKQSKIN